MGTKVSWPCYLEICVVFLKLHYHIHVAYQSFGFDSVRIGCPRETIMESSIVDRALKSARRLLVLRVRWRSTSARHIEFVEKNGMSMDVRPDDHPSRHDRHPVSTSHSDLPSS